MSALTVRHESTYIILLLTWHDESVNDDKNDDFHTSTNVSNPLGLHSGDDVTIECWWRHYNQTIVTQSMKNNI